MVLTIISYDGIHSPDVVALGASLALGISDIPWGVRLLVCAQELRRPRTARHIPHFAGMDSFINMIELEGKEISEKIATDVFVSTHEEIKKLITFQQNIIKELGKRNRM